MNETQTQEERLRAEIEDLKRQLEDQKRLPVGHAAVAKKPSCLLYTSRCV